MTSFRALTFIVLLWATCSAAVAQPVDTFDRSRLNTAAYYNYSEQGDITILVHVWGSVRFPGLYEVPVNTRFTQIISLAGGPLIGERPRRTTRTVRVRIERTEGGRRRAIYDEQMRNGITLGDEDPFLSDGDVVAVESVVKQGFSWRDLFPVVAAVASVTLAVERLSSK